MNILKIAIEKGYTVNEKGEIFNKKGVAKGKGFNNGYPTLSFRVNGIKTSILCHRLIAYVKYGDKIFEPGIMVRHLNAIKTDLSWENICIGTARDNRMDISPEDRLKYALIATSHVRKYDKEAVKKYYEINGWKKTMANFGISSKGTLSYLLNK